jgi:hypothetical protein
VGWKSSGAKYRNPSPARKRKGFNLASTGSAPLKWIRLCCGFSKIARDFARGEPIVFDWREFFDLACATARPPSAWLPSLLWMSIGEA